MMLYLNSPDAPTHRVSLDACSNLRETDGWHRPCPEACLAHFDGWADPRLHYDRTGNVYTPLPNSILAWVYLLPGTSQLESWCHDQDSHAALVVNLYRNDSSFFERDQAAPVWVVTCVGTIDGSHYCALFDNEADARVFYASEVSDFEEVLHDR